MTNKIINVLEFLENSAQQFPDKVAFADETEQITYSELVRKARRMASGIVCRVQPRSPVAVLGQKSVQMVAAFFACVYAGCFYVPLNPLHPQERRNSILSQLSSPLILVQQSCRELVKDADGKVLFYEDADREENDAALEKIRAGHIDTDPLYVMFTSGSTGIPKGIAVSHRSVIDFIEEFTELFGIDSLDVIGNQAPFDFDVSVKDIYSTVKTGATMQIIPKKMFSFPVVLIDYLIARKVTTLIWAVSALCILSGLRAFTYKVPTLVRKVLFSGEAMPIKQLNVWKTYLPEAMFVNLYGPTEITCNCTYYILEKGQYCKDVLPIGKPFRNERVFLLDDENRLIENTDTAGEICVAGTALSLGYYNDVSATERAFIRNPLQSAFSETIYKTGDLAYYDKNGDLCFIGRRDFQIKHMGHRIELGEIESALLKMPGIARAVCLYDKTADKLYSFYQGDAEPPAVAKFLRDNLPAYMIPHKFIGKDKFPLNENGKIDRNKLREEYKND